MSGQKAVDPMPTTLGAQYLTTADAARYCAFRTASAIRKAHLEGRLMPVARRGGKGTWVWSVGNRTADGVVTG